MRDFAEVRGDGSINGSTAAEGLDLFGVDELGLDKVDRAILETLCGRFGGQPIGLTTLAQCVGEETDTIEDAYEPYLLQCGLILRTSRVGFRRPGPGRISVKRRRRIDVPEAPDTVRVLKHRPLDVAVQIPDQIGVLGAGSSIFSRPPKLRTVFVPPAMIGCNGKSSRAWRTA